MFWLCLSLPDATLHLPQQKRTKRLFSQDDSIFLHSPLLCFEKQPRIFQSSKIEILNFFIGIDADLILFFFYTQEMRQLPPTSAEKRYTLKSLSVLIMCFMRKSKDEKCVALTKEKWGIQYVMTSLYFFSLSDITLHLIK